MNPAVSSKDVTRSRVPTKHTAKTAIRRSTMFREYSSGFVLSSSTKYREPMFNTISIIPKNNLLLLRKSIIV